MARDNTHVFSCLKDFRAFAIERVARDPHETYLLRQEFGRRDHQFDIQLQMTGQVNSWRPFTIRLTFERATELYEAWKKNKYDAPIGVRTLPGILGMLGEDVGKIKAEAFTMREAMDAKLFQQLDHTVRTHLAPFARETAQHLAQRLSDLLPESRELLGKDMVIAIDALNAIAAQTETTL